MWRIIGLAAMAALVSSPASASPITMGLQAFCFPFYGGFPREKIAEKAQAAGWTLGEGYAKGVPVGFRREVKGGWLSIHIPVEGDFCEVSFTPEGWEGAPGALATPYFAEIDAWSPTLTPAYRFTKTSQITKPDGRPKAEWTSSAGNLQIYEIDFIGMVQVTAEFRGKKKP